MTNRNVIEVIDRILECIPGHEGWKANVQYIRRNACFRAPEMQHGTWIELVDVLTKNLPDPYEADTPEWCKKIGRIMRAEE